MDHPDFTNLIVTYNSGTEISGLLNDLRSHAPSSHTIVIDNASSDATPEMVRASFPQVQLTVNQANVGYARAVNQGFVLSETEYVFLLNPDIRIHSSRVFLDLQNCLQDNSRVAVAGPLQFKDAAHGRQLNFTWSYWTPQAFRVYFAYLLQRGWDSSEPIRVTYLNAGCLFVRRSAFEAVGRLNEKYFLYGEEPDLFLKLARYGFECRLLPGVSVVHARERSLARVPSLSRLRFKLQGGWNIADALLRGMAHIMWDRLTRSKPA